MSDVDRYSYAENSQRKPKKLKKKKNKQFTVTNYVRTTPLDMVCRDPDRDLMYQKNEFGLVLPEDQVRLQMNEPENNENISSLQRSEHFHEPENYQPNISSNILQESTNDNIIRTDNDPLTDDEQVEMIQKKIKTIFTFYSSYGDRLNISNLKSSKFKRMMIDCGIADIIPKKKIDLIFYSQSKSRAAMSFESFLNALTKISQTLSFSKKGPVEGFHTLINKHMLPLYDEILKSPNYLTVSILENDLKFDEICNYVIKSVGTVLYEVYSAYFPWEIANSTIYTKLDKKSEKAYKQFINDFDICPSILTKTMSFQIWNSVINLENETYREMSESICGTKAFGKCLSFSKFVDLLVKISYLFARDSQDIPSETDLPSEIFIMLLEKLELSNGFLNLEKKTNKPHTSRTSLLPPKDVMMLIQSAKQGDSEEVISYIRQKNHKMIKKAEKMRFIQDGRIIQHNVPQVMPTHSMDKHSEYFERENQPLYEVNQLEEPQIEHVPSEPTQEDDTEQDLYEVFEMHCGLGYQTQGIDFYPAQNGYEEEKLLSSTNFIKMMNSLNSQDSSPLVQDEDIDVIFEKARFFKSQNGNESLTFDQFKFSLNLIAMKVFGYSPDGLQMLTQDYIIPLKDIVADQVTANTEHILQLMEILKDDEMIQLLELVYQTVYPYFEHYSENQELMSLSRFSQLCRDFNIFPDILPEEVVMDFFKTLSNFYCSSSGEDSQHQNLEPDMIDENLFVEVLALSALEMKFQDPQPSQIEKVIVLLDCMNNTEIAIQIYSSTGEDPNDKIKSAYPHLFQEN
ncbi:unnamed protein product [Moneuplotes crassus]|uniref:Uncharacterized protein n=1 Tax=Euplotes crassus TaxID=5936 RepID=A0AAD2D7Q8_EUPCR|nr:unnamed protein product [Moneuplotes crassus]